MRNTLKNTKAEMLAYIKPKLKAALVLDLLYFTVKEWNQNKKKCLQEIENTFCKGSQLIVRSSTLSEDQAESSQAGKYCSLMNVEFNDLESAINKVILSFNTDNNSLDQILIQSMLISTLSGVVFTKDPNTGADYYIINYETEGDTAVVTSGSSAYLKTQIIAKSCKYIQHPLFQQLINLSLELEEKLNISALDIEFAFDKSGKLYLFQVRPLIVKKLEFRHDQTNILNGIKRKYASLNAQHPYLCGEKTILGIMPDWNPAEIIGVRPKPLALSLYKELVTDKNWAYQRDNYGYRNLRSFPLMVDLMGLPYVDVRVSFNSFIPKDLDVVTSNKLVNYYLTRLESEPHLHDKVEFEIIFSCYAFNLDRRISALREKGFSEIEINKIMVSLKELTNRIIQRDTGLWIKDIKKIEELKERHERIFFNGSFDDLNKIYWLIEDCKRYGTLPFAGLARAGFIAVELLNSMVEVGVLSSGQKLEFLNGLDSISTKLTKDLTNIERDEFLKKYGHLRPGTYDITSARYDEAPDAYFDWRSIKKISTSPKEEFKLSLSQMKKIEDLLIVHGLEHDVVGLFTFIKEAIEGREYAKFVFTKTVSDVLLLLKNYAAQNSITDEDIAYLDIKEVLNLHSTSWNVLKEFRKSIEVGKEKYGITSQVILPPIISKIEDVEYFDLPEMHPNFITMKSVTGDALNDLNDIPRMQNAIVFIPSADPGYDWIFTHNVAGFVTAYGGVNSHMAIRAGELGLPAVIGAGESLYNKWSAASKIHIDCRAKFVKVVH